MVAKRNFDVAVLLKGKKKSQLAGRRFTKKGANEFVTSIAILKERGRKRVGGRDISLIKRIRVVKVK